jgi:hypothetical protein
LPLTAWRRGDASRQAASGYNESVILPPLIRENAMDFNRLDELRRQWIDQYVVANTRHPELKRFGETVGRVVTVNYNGKALVDFQDGGWYDITADPEFLRKLDPEEGKKKYKNINSAQPIPDKQS